MPNDLDAIFARIDADAPRMLDRVRRWASINTGTLHRDGLDQLASELVEACDPLGEVSEHDLPPYQTIDAMGEPVEHPLGRAIEVKRRPSADRSIFLGIHYDTVYPSDHPFQQVSQIEGGRINGPGVADAKGGIAVMLAALEALEAGSAIDSIGYHVLLNPDEEMASPGSAALLDQAAKANDLGLVFEPTLPNGSLIAARKGSGNYTLVILGRSAHAGRAFFEGRNALHLAGEAITELTRLTDKRRGVTVNVGKVDGGGPVNVVADRAIVRFNVRVEQPADQVEIEARLNELVARLDRRDGFTATLHGRFRAPPKPLDRATEQLLSVIHDCGLGLALDVRWQSSGGVCDGNRLAAAGLPVVDTLGPRGGDIHSSGEYLIVESLAERAKLTASILYRLANTDIAWPGDEHAGHHPHDVDALPRLFE